MPENGRDHLVRSLERTRPPDPGVRPARPGSRRELPALSKTHRARPRPPFECIALVLQGGGALGAYQAGVYEALDEAKINPDWVAGVSIGAINSAIIAGNEPAARLEKVRSKMAAGSMPSSSKDTTRLTSVRVFPVPGPACSW